MNEDLFGYVCDTCGLSDFGRERLLSFGFAAAPCGRCIDHFTPVLGPPVPETWIDPDEDEPALFG